MANNQKNDKLEQKRKRQKETERQIFDTWQGSSELGRMKYAMKFGFYTWGIPTFTIYSLIMLVLNALVKTTVRYDLYQAGFALFFFVIFGIGYGMVIWNRNEKIFRSKFPYGKK